jgi:hypothetical protein
MIGGRPNANGSFTYTPSANFNGTDTFTYHANDGTANSNIATVAITINAVDDPPVAVNDAYTTGQNTVLTIAAPGVLANDTDIENDPLTAQLVTNPSHGTLTLNGDGSLFMPLPWTTSAPIASPTGQATAVLLPILLW